MTAGPEAALEVLRRRFVARCAGDLAWLEGYAGGGDGSPEELRYLVHRLAGTAGVFGYAAVSDAGAEVETALLEGQARAALPIRPLLAELKAMLRAAEA